MTLIEWLTAVGAALGILLGLCTLGGLLVRYALLPWLKEHIATPLRETHQQVTVNGHTSATPTLLDRVDTATAQIGSVAGKVDDVAAQVEDAVERVNVTGRMLDGHLDRSAGEWGRLWSAIDDLREHVGLARIHHHREDNPA